MPQSSLETSVIAFTCGAACLAVLQWLQDVRSKPGRNSASGMWSASPGGVSTVQASSAASPSSSDTPPEAPAPERVSLLLLKGKHGRSESSPAAIEEACSFLLLAAGVPHAFAQTQQAGLVYLILPAVQTSD